MKILRIPKKPLSLEINGHIYTIRFIEGGKAEYGTEDCEILGAVSMRKCDIILERDMKHSKILEVLCHEVLHAITHGTSLNISETQVQVIANSLYQLGVGNYIWEKSGGEYDSKL
tara:strand:- start:295 stop:639 length:345 start_codon:yes stop_codon:yes gene_type:complete